MKYRRLTLEELQALEKEFTQFLVANDVLPEQWQTIKDQEPEKAEGLIRQFSDIVLDKVYGKIEYLEYRTAKELKIFHFQDEQIEIAGLHADPDNPSIDLTDEQSVNQLAQNFGNVANEGDVKVFYSEKAYDKEPRVEIFELAEAGCEAVDGQLFNVLKTLYKKNKGE